MRYMGKDSMQPFLADQTKGVWALCKTSNKGSDDIQTCTLGELGWAWAHRSGDMSVELIFIVIDFS